MTEIQVEEVQDVQEIEQSEELQYALIERTVAINDKRGIFEKFYSRWSLRIIEWIPLPMRSFGEKVYTFFNTTFRRFVRIACDSSLCALSSIIVLLAPLMLEYRKNDERQASKRTSYERNSVFVI